jgi:hypothetical protein
MKLSKLSLAAIVALGALSTTASATPLEEAIKGVDLSGFARIRIYNESDNAVQERYRFSAPFNFKMPVADNLTAGMTIRYESSTYDANGGGSVNIGDAANNFGMVKAWFQYATADYSAKMGRFELGTPWTDPGYGGDRGDGILAFYTGFEGVTLAAGAFVNSTAGADENLNVAAAITSFGPINAQVWGVTLSNVIDSAYFVQLDGKMDNFNAAVQFSSVDLDGGADRGAFWGVKVGAKFDNVKLCAGYTSNDEDQGVYTLNADDMGHMKWGKQLYYQSTNAAGADTFAITADASFGKFGVGAGYIDSSDMGANGVDGDEFYGQVSYAYANNFKTTVYYSAMDSDIADNDEIRAEFKYSF